MPVEYRTLAANLRRRCFHNLSFSVKGAWWQATATPYNNNQKNQ